MFGDHAPSFAPARALEEAVRTSGAGWTVLRPSGFTTNTLAWAQGVREADTVWAPFADVALPFVDPADIAQVAATALVGPDLAGRTLVLTGPEALSPRRRVRLLGRELRLVELDRAGAAEQMGAFMPALVVQDTLDILGGPSAQEQAVSPQVAQVLGRAATSFEDWARAAVAGGLFT